MEAIESVIKSLETIPTAADFRSMLAKTVPAADRRPCSCDSEMTARVCEIFTHCSDYCIPKYVTQEQAKRLESVLEKFKATPDDERALKAMFHDQVPKENPQVTSAYIHACNHAREHALLVPTRVHSCLQPCARACR